MSFLNAMPGVVASAATDLAGIGSTINTASGAAAAATTELLSAGADEVSAAIAALFGAHGQAYQAFSAQAALFHDRFVQTITASAAAYAGAESANASPLQALAANSPANILAQIEQAQIDFNTNLVNGELGFNQALVANEVGLEQRIFGTDSALNGVINRGFNVGNLLLGTVEQTANSLIGAPVPENFTSSLLLGSSAQVFNSGQIGGLVGAFDQSLALGADLVGLVTGQ